MHRIYSKYFFIVVLCFFSHKLWAQNDTLPVSVNPALQEILNSKYPKTYTIGGIIVTGTKAFDPVLIASISGLAVGDKIQLPGSDAFGKAIAKLWKQSLVSKVDIFITRLEDQTIYLEINVTERPRLIDFKFIGIKKGEKDDLEPKMGLSKDRVITENMRISAVEAIRKFYYEKGYRNVTISVNEEIIEGASNGISLTFLIVKGSKVKINSLNFSGNEQVDDIKLKKQMKGTKEMARMTLYPDYPVSPYGDTSKGLTFNQYLRETGYMFPTKTLELLDPYFRFKIFSGSKFNEAKYDEDKDKILDYYNAQGLRDAVLVADTQILNRKGNMDIHIKVNEGRKYYFGNMTWKGNTKYSDSILNLLLGIQK